MFLNIDEKVFLQHPDLKIGAILIKGMNNTRRISSVESLLRGICAQRKREFQDTNISDEPMVKVWEHAYGKFGINPTKYRPSISSLLHQAVSGKEIPHINALVDLYNYFSLKFLLPIGGEDIDWLCGDLNLKFTNGGEPFRPLGSINVKQASEGELCYIDNGGITCRYWNYRECERTKFSEQTRNALILVEDLSKMHMDTFGSILKEIQLGIIKYIGGQIEPYLLNEENRSINLGVQGRINVDDSKVPQQEKIHFLEKQKKQKIIIEEGEIEEEIEIAKEPEKIKEAEIAKEPEPIKNPDPIKELEQITPSEPIKPTEEIIQFQSIKQPEKLKIPATPKIPEPPETPEPVSQLNNDPEDATNATVILTTDTQEENSNYIDRGYQNLDEKLRSLGADIQRV